MSDLYEPNRKGLFEKSLALFDGKQGEQSSTWPEHAFSTAAIVVASVKNGQALNQMAGSFEVPVALTP
jgi:hypothetical protein